MFDSAHIRRRDFLLKTALAGGALASAPRGHAAAETVSLVVDSTDPVAASEPVVWAMAEFERALEESGRTMRRRGAVREAGAGERCIVASSRIAQLAKAPESLALFSTTTRGRPVVSAGGSDVRGLTYALLELADRARHGMPLEIPKPVAEQPANPVRSVMRQFTSEALDKPWFYDREGWQHYLTMLAANRFNRLHLGFGLGYDFLQQVADSYFLFLYPFLVKLPGYQVRASNLPDAERDRNLDTLRFISEQTALRGMDFQLGVWMHGYQLTNSPRARYLIEGLTNETHGPYCRDALTAVLRACPKISAVALRIHGESGVAEGSYDFWRTVFDGVKACGRKVEIDLHAKGIDATMIDSALATGLPVSVSAKCWAEHMGMPYHPAEIREQERPVEGHVGSQLMALSEGARSFTRYGYADLLREDRKYTVRHRVFSGTQRLLLWAEPRWAAAYSRAFSFCGSTGADLMEPLTCRGRRGTAAGSTRCGYADLSLEPPHDWQKYEQWYRVWGRALYNPETEAGVFQRPLRKQFGKDAEIVEAALAKASRVLPLVTTAHLPSAACDTFWPEIYWNMPMVDERTRNPYGDTPSPKTFQNVSPLDPQLFSRMTDFADELLKGESSGKYSPLEVASWLEDCADATTTLSGADFGSSPEFRRAAVDVDLLTAVGHFFALKLRAGVLYAIYERTGDRAALEEALDQYKAARSTWADVAKRAKLEYASDLSAGDRYSVRGQWADRVPAIDEDIAAMEQKVGAAKNVDEPRVRTAIAEVLEPPERDAAPCTHQPPQTFRAKEAVALEVAVPTRKVTSARIYYRHVNQAERFQSIEMEKHGDAWAASIPAAYTDFPYPLQYYFEVRESSAKAWLYPGLGPELTNQPYFVVRRG
ncbi:MAG: hypothetical protein ABSF62_08490 [Bryobacteraceae bacterium]